MFGYTIFSASLFIHQIKSVSYMCASPNLVNAAVDCCGVALLCSPKIKHIRLGSTSARGARDAPTWGGSLARARLIYSAHSAQGLRLSPYLKPFPFCRTLFSCSSFPGGDDRASGGDICHFFAQPCAGDEHPPGMPAPSLSFCCARWSTPNPDKIICTRICIQLQYIIY